MGERKLQYDLAAGLASCRGVLLAAAGLHGAAVGGRLAESVSRSLQRSPRGRALLSGPRWTFSRSAIFRSWLVDAAAPCTSAKAGAHGDSGGVDATLATSSCVSQDGFQTMDAEPLEAARMRQPGCRLK